MLGRRVDPDDLVRAVARGGPSVGNEAQPWTPHPRRRQNRARPIRVPLAGAKGAFVSNEPMTSHSNSVIDELKRLVAEGQISADALHVITGVPVDSMRSLLAEAPLESAETIRESAALSAEENGRLSILTAQLTDGLQIDDDERLKGILESLTIECHLTLENIAGLTGTDVHDLELALQDPHALSADKKYTLAIKGSYLINAVNQVRR